MSALIHMPAWQPGRLLPRFTDKELLALVRRSDTDLRPWAAFTLGFQSRRIGVTQAAIAGMPELIEQCYNEIPRAVSELKVACDVLVDIIPLTVAFQLRKTADCMEKWNDTVAKAVGRPGADVRPPTAVEVEAAERLPVLADRCLEMGNLLNVWYDTARGLADARPAQMGTVLMPPPAHLLGLLKCVRRLPGEHSSRWRSERRADATVRWPELRSITDLSESQERDESALERDYLGPDVSKKTWCQAELYWRLNQVATEMEAYLREVSKPRPTPFWDSVACKLYYEGELIMSLNRGRASAIVLILDAFQEFGWPPQGIDDLNGCAGETKKGHIRTLNESLDVKRIKFCGNGTKLGIKYEPI